MDPEDRRIGKHSSGPGGVPGRRGLRMASWAGSVIGVEQTTTDNVLKHGPLVVFVLCFPSRRQLERRRRL